jgi:hypothetical protein
MKLKLLSLIACIGLLAGCANSSYYGCSCSTCCTYVTYTSQCGAASCTYNPLDLDDP